MRKASSAENEIAGGSGSRPTIAGREPGLPALESFSSGPVRFTWLLAAASVAVIVFIYFFAFRAAQAAQIKDVPLAAKGGRP